MPEGGVVTSEGQTGTVRVGGDSLVLSEGLVGLEDYIGAIKLTCPSPQALVVSADF